MSKKLQSPIKNKKILITGGAGFIGSHLAEALVQNNRVTIFDNLRRNALQYTDIQNHKNINIVKGDVLDKKNLEDTIKGQDYVVHLAAIAGVSSYYKNPLATLEVDAWGTYNVLDISSRLGIKHVITSSTSEVYGINAKDVSETSSTVQGPATDSRWSYAVGKLVGDHFAFAFSKVKKLPVTIVRPFNVYGPRQVGEGAIQIFVKQSLEGEPLTIRGKGKQKRAWCYITDFIQAIIQIMGNPNAFGEIFNIGNDKEIVDAQQLATIIKEITQSRSVLEYMDNPFTEIEYRSPNIEKARKLLGYTPSVSLHNGLKHTIDWYKSYEKTS